MPPSSEVLRADFDRIAATRASGDEIVEPAVRRLIAEVPLRSRVLEIGCGTGELARALASKRGAKVTAIDPAPRMIDVARHRTAPSLGIDYRVADFLAISPRGFDIVTSANTLHHLPLAAGAAHMAASVVPGGKVLVADLFSARGLCEVPYNAVSYMLRTSRPTTPALVAAWDARWEHDAIPTLAQVRRALAGALPGVRVRRHLGWRYTVIWQRP